MFRINVSVGHILSLQIFAFLQHKDCAVEPVDSVGEIFPVLEIGQLPGSAIRSHCWVIGDYRFSVVGYDTGCVIASCCTMHSGTIIDRFVLKFYLEMFWIGGCF